MILAMAILITIIVNTIAAMADISAADSGAAPVAATGGGGGGGAEQNKAATMKVRDRVTDRDVGARLPFFLANHVISSRVSSLLSRKPELDDVWKLMYLSSSLQTKIGGGPNDDARSSPSRTDDK